MTPGVVRLEEIRRNAREAVNCYFDETTLSPKLIRPHFVRDEVLAARNCPAR